jgi:hypothetical protein
MRANARGGQEVRVRVVERQALSRRRKPQGREGHAHQVEVVAAGNDGQQTSEQKVGRPTAHAG